MTTTWIKKKLNRVTYGLSTLYRSWKMRTFLNQGAKPQSDDGSSGSESVMPARPPRFPPSLMAAAGFSDVREQAFYGRTGR
jgi:hypothetical protein